MMKLQSYKEITDISVGEIKRYVFGLKQGVYDREIEDIVYLCLDQGTLQKRLNQRKDIQLWLFTTIKKEIDQAKDYDEMQYHLIMMNKLINPYYRPLIEYKYHFFYYILKKAPLSMQTYSLLRHLLAYQTKNTEVIIDSICQYLSITGYEYSHIMSEVLLLERQYKQAYRYLQDIEFDESLQFFQHQLYHYSPYRFEKYMEKQDFSKTRSVHYDRKNVLYLHNY